MTDAVELPRVTMAWLTPPIFEPGNYDATVTKRLLDGTRASRLTRRLVHDLRIAQSVKADVESMADASVFTITATAKPGHGLGELETAVDAELADLARRGPTRSEVEAAETTLIANSVGDLDDLGNFGGLADGYNFYNHYLGDPDRIGDDLRRTAAVSPDRVRRFVAGQLAPGRRVVIEVTPGPRTPVDDPPAPPETNDTRPAAPASAEPWRNAVPAPGPAVTTPLPPVQRFTLTNGLAVWLVESHRLPLVGASLVSRLGSGADPPDRPGLAELTTGTLDSGTTNRDALGMSRELEAAGATLSDDTGKDGTWLSASALTDHAPAALDILSDAVRNPTFPGDEVDGVRDDDIVALRQTRDDADTVADTVAERAVFGAGDPYAHPIKGTEDGLRAVTVDDLRRAHDRAFTPATTALVLAGDVTPAEARTLAEGAFGSWTGGAAAPAAPAPASPTGQSASSPSASGAVKSAPKGRVLLVDKPDSSQTALVLAAPGVARADPDYEPLLVTNEVFGGAFSSRLNQDLRETRGYTYGVSSRVNAMRRAGLLTITMDVQTGSTADAVKETLADAGTLAGSGVTADELDRARQSLAGSLPALFSTATDTLSTLRTLYLNDEPVDYYRNRPGRLAGISGGDVAVVAQRWFQPGAFTVVAVGDRSAIQTPLGRIGVGPVTVTPSP